ncbi:MAG TPA: hypothetical protein VMM13_00780 [Euzebya sp.]|nr:hypothetical protein [Euzebya sp.]
MDDLELVVGKCQLDQQRQLAFVEVALEVTERGGHLWGRWGDEDGVVECVAADPDRTGAQLTGSAVLTAHATEQQLVHLAHQTNGHREAASHPAQAVLHRKDVVPHLSGIIGLVSRWLLACLEPQQPLDVGLGSLDARAQHGFQPQARTITLPKESPQ